MPDCFISYSTQDSHVATFIHRELASHGVDAFLASASLKPGERWSPTILEALDNSDYVIVLASKAAASSAYVNQEIGAALASAKQVIPIVWDMSPKDLPGWLGERQAVNLRGASVPDVRKQVEAIAAKMHADAREKFVLVVGLLLLFLFLVPLGGWEWMKRVLAAPSD